MEEVLIQVASAQGIWTTLSVFLIFYILKNQDKRDKNQDERENKYQDIISTLTDHLKLIEDVKEDVKEVKNFIFKERG